MHRSSIAPVVLFFLSAPVAAQETTVDLATGVVRDGFSGEPVACPVWMADPKSWGLAWTHMDWLEQRDADQHLPDQHRLPDKRRAKGTVWFVGVGDALVVGTDHIVSESDLTYVDRGAIADHVFALHRDDGRLLWCRDDLPPSTWGADFTHHRLVVTAEDRLLVLDADTGATVTSLNTPPGRLQSICRDFGGYDVVKTSSLLAVFDSATGSERWHAPASEWSGAPLILGTRLVSAYLDFSAVRYGVEVYDFASGQLERRIDLGPISGFDFIRFDLAAAGPQEVSVRAMFAVE